MGFLKNEHGIIGSNADNLACVVLEQGEPMYKAQPYVAVNAAWPEQIPVPTAQEALSGAKKLYRKFRKKAWPGKWELTSGNRHTWPRRGTYYVNPNYDFHGGGWKAIVHSMSHYMAHRIHPTAKGHGSTHAFIEKEMIEYVVSQGWLNGNLKRSEKERAVVDLKQVRHQRVLAGISRWEAKLKRAKTALKKLNRQRAYYENKAA